MLYKHNITCVMLSQLTSFNCDNSYMAADICYHITVIRRLTADVYISVIYCYNSNVTDSCNI